MKITIEVAEVNEAGNPIGSPTRIIEDRIEAAAFEAGASLATLLRTHFTPGQDVFVTINASEH